MAFGGIKVYHLIHLDFGKRVYSVFQYEKDRRLTANQAWKMIRQSNPILTDKLGVKSTIEDYYQIIEKLGYNEKYCDRYMTFWCN